MNSPNLYYTHFFFLNIKIEIYCHFIQFKIKKEEEADSKMNAPHSRSRNSSTTESESVTDLSCADSIPIAVPVQHQRLILTPKMYFQDAVYRTFAYATPPPQPPLPHYQQTQPSLAKNYAKNLAQDMQRTGISTCIKQAPDSSSYRYRYYAPSGPVPASRLIKGEAAPKHFASIEQSMSFQNFPSRIQYSANQSFDGSYRNMSFEPMNYESRHYEQYNRPPVSNMWQMAGSSANITNSSKKFLNQFANDPLQPIGTGPGIGYNNNYFQEKNFLNQSPSKFKNNFKLKAFAIIGLVLVIVISIAVILSVLITRSTLTTSARSLPLEESNQKRLSNSTLVNSAYNETIGNLTDNDSILVGVDISLNVTSNKAFILDNSTNSNNSNSSLSVNTARMIFSQLNSTTKTNSYPSSKIFDKLKNLDTSNGTIYDFEMLSNYSNSTLTNSTSLSL